MACKFLKELRLERGPMPREEAEVARLGQAKASHHVKTGMRISCTTSAHMEATMIQRAAAAVRKSLRGCRAVFFGGDLEHLAVEGDEVAKLGGLPHEDIAPFRAGEDGKRQEPEHVLLRPDLAEEQERGQDEEAQLREPGHDVLAGKRAALSEVAEGADADAGQGEQDQVRLFTNSGSQSRPKP